MRICFIGDSTINGTGDPEYLGWPGRACAAARRRGHDITLYNLGVRRDTSRDIADRWSDEARRRLPSGVASGVDGRLVFAFGVNDCIVESDAPRIPPAPSLATAEMILAGAAARYPTLMVGPPPLPDRAVTSRIVELSAALAALCAALDVPFLDAVTPLARSGTWVREAASGDGAHPGAAGYAELAALVDAWPAWRRWLP